MVVGCMLTASADPHSSEYNSSCCLLSAALPPASIASHLTRTVSVKHGCILYPTRPHPLVTTSTATSSARCSQSRTPSTPKLSSAPFRSLADKVSSASMLPMPLPPASLSTADSEATSDSPRSEAAHRRRLLPASAVPRLHARDAHAASSPVRDSRAYSGAPSSALAGSLAAAMLTRTRARARSPNARASINRRAR